MTDENLVLQNQRLAQELEETQRDLEGQLEETSSLYDQVAALHHLFALFGKSSDYEAIIGEALQFCTETLRASKAFIGILEGDRLFVRESIGLPAEEISEVLFGEQEALFDFCRENNRTVIVNDPEMDKRMRSSICQMLGMKHLICSPLSLGSTVIGFLVVGGPESGEEFNAGNGQLVNSISHPLANVLENARLHREEIEKRLMEREMDIARRIQSQLLPTAPADLPGVDIDGRTVPALAIGGDYFDFFRLDKGRVAVALADAVGKGVSAGLLMTMLKGMLHALPLPEHSPAQVMEALNKAFFRQALKEHFVTMVYLTYDAWKRTVCMSNAGHEPPLILRREQSKQETLDDASLPLGVKENVTYSETNAQLTAGDILVVYSDGLTEAKDAQGVEFGFEQLVDTVARSAHKPVFSIANDLFDAVQRHSEQRAQGDDMTSIILKAEAIELRSPLMHRGDDLTSKEGHNA